MNWIDIFCLIIIGLSSLMGLFRGFILSFFGILTYVIAFFFTKEYYGLLAKYIEGMKFVESIRNFFVEQLQGLKITDGGLDFSKLDAVPKFLGNILGKSVSDLENVPLLSSAKLKLANSMTDTTVSIISFIVLFLVSVIILTILVRVLNSIFSLPVLKEFNKLVGLAFGAIRGILIVMVIFTLIPPIDAMFANIDIIEGIRSSKFSLYLYEYNLVYMILDIFI